MDTLTTDRLLELVERKLHLLNIIKQMTLKQTEFIHSDAIDDLLAILNRKNEAMEALRFVQEQIVPFQSQNAETRVWASDALKVRCRESVDQCERLLAELIEMENMSVQTLAQERDLIGTQLRSMQSSQTINRAYEQHSFDADDDSVSCLSLEG